MKLVFDLGATTTRFGLSSDGVHLGRTLIVPTQAGSDGPGAFIRASEAFVGNHKIQQIAGGVAGTIDREAGILLESPNLPEWSNVHLGQMLEAAFGIVPLLENDTAVVGLGEVIAYGRKGITAYVTVSTGVNGARYVDGALDRSTYGFELGREFIPTAKGELKTLEELISGHMLQQRYGRLPSTIDDPAVWEAEAGYLALGLYNMMLMWSPAVIILGGSMMNDIDIKLVAHKMSLLPKVFAKLPELRKAELDSLGGLYGALELIHAHKRKH
ncbi:MAG: ROK family protein [Candidatus Saccharibacteria bacterium]